MEADSKLWHAPVILITVSSKEDFGRDVSEALQQRFSFQDLWHLSYDDVARLRSVGTEQNCIVVIDFGDSARALSMARAADGCSHFANIAVGSGRTRDELLQLMQAGIREVLPRLTPPEIVGAVHRAVLKLTTGQHQVGDIFAFLPAKPGCGATTIATHATAAASRLISEPPLLLDFDIRLGVTSFLLKAEGSHTIVDALQQSDRLDDHLWSNLVSERDNLHLLGSGPMDFSRPVFPGRFSELLDFALRKYSLVAVDLPGAMEDHECETLARAKRVFLVCTSDIGALHVARRKSNWLRDRGLAGNVSAILNCVQRRNALPAATVERIIQMPVRYMVPEGTSEIARLTQKGATISGSSALAKQIAKIASDMTAGMPLLQKPNPVRRFVEYFSISAAREIQPK
jgi:Flp pilus assembly CpaE family ATPase